MPANTAPATLHLHIAARETVAELRVPGGEGQRFVLPQLFAVHFVMHDALAGGVTRSLALDAHGKTLGALSITAKEFYQAPFRPLLPGASWTNFAGGKCPGAE